MKLHAIAVALVAAAGAAHADAPADPCAAFAQHAERGDAARAALYLDACDHADPALVERVRKQLDKSELSKVDVVTMPEGLDLVVDAYPDTHVRTPATLWLRAGRHELRVTRAGDGVVLARVVDIKPRSRMPIVIDAAPPKQAAPKEGRADFRDEAPEVEHVGTPPPVKHPPLLPCKYRGECPASGDEIRDPLEQQATAVRDALAMRARLGLRAGVGINMAPHGGYTIGAVGTFALDKSSRFAAVARADFVQRLGTMDTLEAIAIGGGAAVRIATGRAFAITAGLDARGEVRFEGAFGGRGVDRFGFAGDAVLDVVMRRIPLVIGARLQQDVAGVIDSQRATAGIIELAVELR